MVEHGVDGWELVEYAWDEDTGIGSFIYEHETSKDESPVLFMRQVLQPYRPSHAGWYTGAMR